MQTKARIRDQLEALARGERRSLSRLISLVENREEGWLEALEGACAMNRRAFVVGLTGPGGAGKSTLVSALVEYFTSLQKRVSVIAVDPSSPISRGAFLGDRIRLKAGLAEKIFFRSMASRGAYGGIASAVDDVVHLMSAFGSEIIVIETVGVGQDQVDVAKVADLTALVLAPGQGDRIQTMKAGLMEVADCFIVNKADKEGAAGMAADIQAFLHLYSADERLGRAQVFKIIATKSDTIYAFGQFLTEQAVRQQSCRADRSAIDRAIDLCRSEVDRRLLLHAHGRARAADWMGTCGTQNPFTIAREELLLEEMCAQLDALFARRLASEVEE